MIRQRTQEPETEQQAENLKAVSRNVPDPGIARCVELLSSARNVLLVGDAPEELLHALDQIGCSIACVVTGSMDQDEAAIFASRVARVPVTDVTIPPEFADLKTDAIVLCDPSDRLSDLAIALLDGRELLTEDAIVIAGFGMPRFELFTRAGYVVEGADELASSAMGSLLVRARPFAAPQTSAAAPVAETVETLYLELERERAARKQLFDALATAERSATDIERTASDIADRRNDILRRNAELENALEVHARELLAEREARLKLQIALLLSQRTLDAAHAGTADAEGAWYSLFAQLESTRADADNAFAAIRGMLENARRDRDTARAHVDKLLANETSSKERSAQLERTISELERQISEGGAYAKSLLREIATRDAHVRTIEEELAAIRSASLAEKSVMQEYANDVRDRSERLVQEHRSDAAAAVERERAASGSFSRQIENLQRVLREAESRLQGENRDLRSRVEAAEAALAAQTDAIIANMQAESAQLSKLVDTVQTSRFWRFKRWLNRLRGTLRS